VDLARSCPCHADERCVKAGAAAGQLEPDGADEPQSEPHASPESSAQVAKRRLARARGAAAIARMLAALWSGFQFVRKGRMGTGSAGARTATARGAKESLGRGSLA
jgi:hypothetical protein